MSVCCSVIHLSNDLTSLLSHLRTSKTISEPCRSLIYSMFLLLGLSPARKTTFERLLLCDLSVEQLDVSALAFRASSRTIPGRLRSLAYLMFFLGLSPASRTILECCCSISAFQERPSGNHLLGPGGNDQKSAGNSHSWAWLEYSVCHRISPKAGLGWSITEKSTGRCLYWRGVSDQNSTGHRL